MATQKGNPETKRNYLEVLRQIQGNLNLVAYIASKCDARYNQVNGTPYHNPNLFIPPFDEVKARAIKANSLALVAVIAWVQEWAFRHGAKTQEEVNERIIPTLESILRIGNPRDLVPRELLEMVPLDLTQATAIFGEHIGALLFANAMWNVHQIERDDKGLFNCVGRMNVFSSLSLKVLLLDWDQVLVVAQELKHLLTGDNLSKRTMELAAMIPKTE